MSLRLPSCFKTSKLYAEKKRGQEGGGWEQAGRLDERGGGVQEGRLMHDATAVILLH